MKTAMLGLYLLVSLSIADLDEARGGFQRAADRLAGEHVTSAGDDRVDLTPFAAELANLELELSSVENARRDDLLARIGRTSASAGRFKHASAAYALFLSEYGYDHPYSAQIATRYADSLFPLRFDQMDLVHTPEGPSVQATWRMGYTPDRDQLILATKAYDLAASLAMDAPSRGSALLKLGWVYRVLDNWRASTLAWDRCSHEASGTRSAADALWLAAENLRVTDNPAEAARRLHQLATAFPRDPRVSTVGRMVEELEAEAGRPENWSDNPIANLLTEIDVRSPTRAPHETYRSVVRWLERRHNRKASIAVSRWACTQEDWPVEERVACRNQLVDAFLREPGDKETGRREAAERLGEIVDLAPSDAAAVHAALRLVRLLDELGQPDKSDQVAEEIAARVKGSRRLEPIVMTTQIELLLKRGNKDGAKAVLDALAESHPDYDVHEWFDAVFARAEEEGSK